MISPAAFKLKYKLLILSTILVSIHPIYSQVMYQQDFETFWSIVHTHHTYLEVQEIDWHKVWQS